MFSAFVPWCAETCVEARTDKGEKTHQGVSSKNPAPYQGIAWSKSTTALGLRAEGWEKCNGSRCTGKELDSETQFDYFGARYYSSGLGRFVTPDWAAKPAAVPYAVLGDPQSFNLYTYVRNIPTTRYDADGHAMVERLDSRKLPVLSDHIPTNHRPICWCQSAGFGGGTSEEAQVDHGVPQRR